MTYVDDDAPFTALHFQSSIHLERVSAECGQPSNQRRMRSELLLFYVAFTISGECAIHPATQDTSPDAACTAARQSLPP